MEEVVGLGTGTGFGIYVQIGAWRRTFTLFLELLRSEVHSLPFVYRTVS
jgi:hypothetical protein